MAKTWSITGPAKTEVKDGAPAEVMFSITNILAEPVSGLVRLLPQPPLTASSFKPPPDNNLSFAANETKAYTFKFDPTGLDAGTYMYEFTVAPPANPNDPMADRITSSAEVLQKKKRSKWWIYALIAGVLILAAVGAYFVFGGKIEIPDVAGKTPDEAIDTLTDAGFVVDARVVESERPNNSVLGTDPTAGSKKREGDRIDLLLSTGPEIPDLFKSPADAAEAQLIGLGFVVNRYSEATEEVDEGLVLRTAPSATSRALPGQSISLVVATSPQQLLIAVPNVHLKPIALARSDLETAGFSVYPQCLESFTWILPTGIVFFQDPAAGVPHPKGELVRVQYREEECPRNIEVILAEASTNLRYVDPGQP